MSRRVNDENLAYYRDCVNQPDPESPWVLITPAELNDLLDDLDDARRVAHAWATEHYVPEMDGSFEKFLGDL